ncbi:TPA: hypothetical protein ACGR4L_004307 [Serratia marcescens]|nr:hypothetical protein [Serratia marcescens]
MYQKKDVKRQSLYSLSRRGAFLGMVLVSAAAWSLVLGWLWLVWQ